LAFASSHPFLSPFFKPPAVRSSFVRSSPLPSSRNPSCVRRLSVFLPFRTNPIEVPPLSYYNPLAHHVWVGSLFSLFIIAPPTSLLMVSALSPPPCLCYLQLATTKLGACSPPLLSSPPPKVSFPLCFFLLSRRGLTGVWHVKVNVPSFIFLIPGPVSSFCTQVFGLFNPGGLVCLPPNVSFFISGPDSWVFAQAL